MAALLMMAQGAWAQDATNSAKAPAVEPSQTLTEISKVSSCTVYTFNYPSVSATGEPTVL